MFRVYDFVDVGFACGTIIRITRSRATNDLVYVVRLYATDRTIIRHDTDDMTVVENPYRRARR